MDERMKNWEDTPFPDLIRDLPEVDIPFDGVRAWLLQGDSSQLAFFDIQPVGKIPAHAHGAQWGIVIEGELVLSIGEDTKTYRKGDWYYIPAGVTHSAVVNTRVHVIDFFADADRWAAKAN